MLRVDHQAERGASAVVVAASLFLLFGVLSIAVDISAGFGEKRLDQTASDAAALGGSLHLVIADPNSSPVAAAVQKAYDLVDTNLGRSIPYDDPDPSVPDWADCTDSGRLFYSSKNPVFNVSNGSDCISFSEDFNTFRVRLPVQEMNTAFAGVIGAFTLDVSAAAEAERNSDFGGGGNFPSGALGGASLGEPLCLKTGTGSASHESCGDPSTGDFGNFRPYFYGSVDGENSAICVSGEQTAPMSRSMADGIDHDFSYWSAGNDRINGKWCHDSGIPGPFRPNMVDPTGGYSNNDITDGLIAGGAWPTGTSFTGRLTRGPFVSLTSYVYTIASTKRYVDNKPLWEYVDETTVSSISSCTGISTLGHVDSSAVTPPATVGSVYQDRFQATLQCLTDAKNAAGGPIRVLVADSDGDGTSDILQTPRFATVPIFVEPNPLGANSCCYHIADVAPVFIESVYAVKNHVSFSCAGLEELPSGNVCVHRAGIDGHMDVNPPGQKKVDSAGSVVLDCDLLPVGTCSSLPDPTAPLTNLYDLTLTK